MSSRGMSPTTALASPSDSCASRTCTASRSLTEGSIATSRRFASRSRAGLRRRLDPRPRHEARSRDAIRADVHDPSQSRLSPVRGTSPRSSGVGRTPLSLAAASLPSVAAPGRIAGSARRWRHGMKRLGQAVLASTLAIAITGLGLPWGAQIAFAAEAPVLTSVWLDVGGVVTTAVDEAQTFSVNGTFTDGDPADSHYGLIRIGSRFVTATTGIPTGARSFAISRFFPDDSPTGTAQDPFTLTVQVQDSAGLVSNIWTTTVTVRNVPPTVATFGLTPPSILDGESVHASGTFTDPGTKDTVTLA